METVKTLLESTKESLKMQLWWSEEHDKEPQFIEDIPILKQKIIEIDEALLVLFDVVSTSFCNTCKTDVTYWADLDRWTCNCGRTTKQK